jgi:hypothetical protein
MSLLKNMGVLLMVSALVLAPRAIVTAGPVAEEDFEGGATGWSDNTTSLPTDDDGNVTVFTEFLGRFGGYDGNLGMQEVWKTFTLPGNQSKVRVGFDFYQIDSWDNEDFLVYIDDEVKASDSFHHRDTEAPLKAVALPPNANQIYSQWKDERFHYEFEVPVTDTDIKLGFGSTLNSGKGDESWGIDNVRIRLPDEVFARLDEPQGNEIRGAAFAQEIASGDIEGPVTWKIEHRVTQDYTEGIRNEWFDNQSHSEPTIVDPFPTDAIDWTRGEYPAETGWSGDRNSFSVKYTGEFFADHDGDYSFEEHVDDEAWLWIDGEQVLHDGTWNDDTSATVTLDEGWHTIEFRSQEGGGGDFARLRWDPNGGTDWRLMTTSNALFQHDDPSLVWQLLDEGTFNVGGPNTSGEFGLALPGGLHQLRLTVEYDGVVAVAENTFMIPEPSGLVLAALALASLIGFRRRRRSAKR